MCSSTIFDFYEDTTHVNARQRTSLGPPNPPMPLESEYQSASECDSNNSSHLNRKKHSTSLHHTPWALLSPPSSFQGSQSHSEHNRLDFTTDWLRIQQPPSPSPSSAEGDYATCPVSFATTSDVRHPASSLGQDSPSQLIKTRQPIAMSPVQGGSILSADLLAAGDDAVAAYEIVRVKDLSSPSDLSHNPFSSWSPEALEHHFTVIVDAKNALPLRRSAVVADIGACLELLIPKLSLYDKDNATLTSVSDELQGLKQECSDRQLDLNFQTLEELRSLIPPYDLSFMETHQNLYWEVQPRVDEQEGAQTAGFHFLQDPMALREYRLPKFLTSQR